MFTHRLLLAVSLAVTLVSVAIAAESPKLGKPITEADIAAWSITAMPDGTGLPPGSGTAAQGAPIYAQKCVACHGENGKGGGAPGAGPLAGGQPLTNGIDSAIQMKDHSYFVDSAPFGVALNVGRIQLFQMLAAMGAYLRTLRSIALMIARIRQSFAGRAATVVANRFE